MKHQTIFRNARRETGYTQISTILLNDKELSAEALALAVTIISKPIDWIFNLSWARSRFGWGETKSERIARELIARGFARKRRHREEDGTLGPMVYEFTDVPNEFANLPAESTVWQDNNTAKTADRSSLPAENHAVENHAVESAAHIKNRSLQNTDLTKTPLSPPAGGGMDSISKIGKGQEARPNTRRRRREAFQPDREKLQAVVDRVRARKQQEKSQWKQ